MTVISEKGLVGHIIQVTDHTAKVQTIIDTASTVSGTMTSSRDNIICKGTLEEQGMLKATYIPTTANIIRRRCNRNITEWEEYIKKE